MLGDWIAPESRKWLALLRRAFARSFVKKTKIKIYSKIVVEEESNYCAVRSGARCVQA